MITSLYVMACPATPTYGIKIVQKISTAALYSISKKNINFFNYRNGEHKVVFYEFSRSKVSELQRVKVK